MAVKKAPQKSVKRTAKKTAAKKTTAKKPAAKKTKIDVKKGQAFECRVCGYRFVVDQVCGCVEEHLFICCDEPMKKKRARKTT
jgi:rubrerythrin